MKYMRNLQKKGKNNNKACGLFLWDILHIPTYHLMDILYHWPLWIIENKTGILPFALKYNEQHRKPMIRCVRYLKKQNKNKIQKGP